MFFYIKNNVDYNLPSLLTSVTATRFRPQLNNVESVRKQLDAQTDELRQTIEDKLRSAEENRNENMGKMLEKLKDHVSIRPGWKNYWAGNINLLSCCFNRDGHGTAEIIQTFNWSCNWISRGPVWDSSPNYNVLSPLQEEYAQKVRLGHEEAIRQLEERIQAKLEIAEANRETEIMKKLETLREHVRIEASWSLCVFFCFLKG